MSMHIQEDNQCRQKMLKCVQNITYYRPKYDIISQTELAHDQASCRYDCYQIKFLNLGQGLSGEQRHHGIFCGHNGSTVVHARQKTQLT